MLETAADESAEQQTISPQNSAKSKIVDMTNESSIRQVFGETPHTTEDDSDANRITNPYSNGANEQAGFQNSNHQSLDSHDPANLYRMSVPLGEDNNAQPQNSRTHLSEQNLRVRSDMRAGRNGEANGDQRSEQNLQSASLTTEFPQVVSELQTISSLLQTTDTDLQQFSTAVSQLTSMMDGGKTGNSSGSSGVNSVGENSQGSGVSGRQSTETTGNSAAGGGSPETAVTPSTWASTGNGSPTFSDPVINQLEQTDPNIAQTLTDSQLTMTAAGYNQYQGIVAQNVQSGEFPDDESLMQASAYELGEQGGSQADVQAAETAITEDLGPSGTPGDAAVSTYQGGTGNGDSGSGAAGASGTGGTSGDTGSGSVGDSNGSGDSGTTSVSSSVTQTIQAQEASDPTLATTLNAASSAMSSSGFGELENFLAQSNPTANSNLDATSMSNALTQAGLSTADSSALQQVVESDMPMAQVLTYAQTNDPTLYKTITDASTSLSASGYSDLENYLVNDYTTNNNLDSTLMSNALSQAGLSSADQTNLEGVLNSDMPTALAKDPFVAALQTTDPTLAATLTSASSAMSPDGYKSLETYVENNYEGGTSGDAALMNSALTGAGLDSSDASILSGLLQDGTSTGSGSDSGSGGGTTGSGGGDGTTPGTIIGVTSANNAQLAAENSEVVNGNLNGPDALTMNPDTLMLSQNQAGDGFSQKYGFFEADLEAPAGSAGWGGWWLESTAHAADPSQDPSAEIDIMENQAGVSQSQYYTTLHYSSTVDGTTPGTTDQIEGSTITPGTNITDSYNWYGVLNTPGSTDLEFTFNGQVVATEAKYDDTDFSPEELVLDNANGGWANPSQSNTDAGNESIKAVLAFQSPDEINSTNDPGGTLGTNLTDLPSAADPSFIDGMENTFVSNFTQGQDGVTVQGVSDGGLWSTGNSQYPATSTNGIYESTAD